MRSIVIALVLLVPINSWAQNSTTTCRSTAVGQVICDTQAQPSIGNLPSLPPVNYSAQLQPVPPPDAALNAYLAAQARSRQQLIDQAAPLMAAGQCETARSLAVRQGDAELADLIYSTCKPR
jgi:hypothetical protein